MRFLLIPGIVAAISVAIIFAALRIDVSPPIIVGHSLQPRVFPIFLMLINLILVVLLAIKLRKDPETPPPAAGSRTWGSVALFGVFYVCTIYIDMLVAIAVVTFAMCLLWGERRLHVAAALGLLTPGVIFFLFDTVLTIRFPRGLITNWYYG